MAQESGIKNSWSLMMFAKANGRPSLASFEKANEETGEVEHWKSVAFTHPTETDPTTGKAKVCFVGFSSKLGELSVQEIVRQKDELQVVQLNSGSYRLCKQGQGGWEDIDLGL